MEKSYWAGRKISEQHRRDDKLLREVIRCVFILLFYLAALWERGRREILMDNYKKSQVLTHTRVRQGSYLFLCNTCEMACPQISWQLSSAQWCRAASIIRRWTVCNSKGRHPRLTHLEESDPDLQFRWQKGRAFFILEVISAKLQKISSIVIVSCLRGWHLSACPILLGEETGMASQYGLCTVSFPSKC